MKKRLFSICLILVLLLCSCGSKEAVNSGAESTKEKENDKDIIEIKEKLFIAQINDIYINSEYYLGKTIQYEGIFNIYYWDEADEIYYYVIRYGPGCCGDDDDAGFEVAWDGEYPEDNDWVEVTGELEMYKENGTEYLRLNVSSMQVKEARGEEYVES